MTERVYLDWNATTPPAPEVAAAMQTALRETWANPSSIHGFGRAARARVEAARESIARLAGADARDVVLTSGGTEANNLALRSAFSDGGNVERGGADAPGGRGADAPGSPVLVTSRLEHPSVTRVAEALEREGMARVRWVAVRPEGTIDLGDLARALMEGPVRLVAVQAVNAETGVVQPIADVLAAAKAHGALIHVDAVQAFGRTEEVARGADTRSLAGHKMRGPKSMGALIGRPGLRIAPVLVGGSQERGVRPGTIDPVAAAGLHAAAERAVNGPARWNAVALLRDALEHGLLRLYAKARVNGRNAMRAPHVTNIAFPGWAGPELVAGLDLEGIAVSSGTACSAGTAEPSPVLVAMGDREAAACSVRFSLGEDTTREDIDATLAAVTRVFSR
ncbi:MAG TPA: cysteine desulfurase family protein [Polyangiaceae bacterium]|jgi:cysteine desulfurase|nr:cysteine desulfurase family protein [Polyangiaceae bacterium]